MRVYKEVDILHNKKMIIWLNVLSVVLVVGFWILFAQLASFSHPDLSLFSKLEIAEMFILSIGCFILIIIHELIHGLFFKLFTPEGKVTFGFKNGMAYAASVGNYYSKMKYAIIILAPFVFLTLLLTLLFYLEWITPFMYISLASIHAGACVGDFYYILLLIRAPKNIVVEDTSIEMSMFFDPQHT
ncbi:DUF3267 domain-containing protein [Desemzia incerta]|uniref:DUF3267 domain-containing protein n=1 Tax=Desemzia incerta TaxID=82801 RepID=UPI0024C46E00|nr:DUF3267 domain-containing protein [Desemzia incerta]WHZ32482.1 DUF3267 domain-containing protein [Desemzia incerta]